LVQYKLNIDQKLNKYNEIHTNKKKHFEREKNVHLFLLTIIINIGMATQVHQSDNGSHGDRPTDAIRSESWLRNQ
jgi:hypothetical protein